MCQTDLLIPALYPLVPSLVTNEWLQQRIPKLSQVPIAQELSAANAQQGLVVVRLHHLVQHQQHRVTDRRPFCNLSHPPCRNRFIQSNKNVRSIFPRTRKVQGLGLNCIKIKHYFRQMLIPLVSVCCGKKREQCKAASPSLVFLAAANLPWEQLCQFIRSPGNTLMKVESDTY
jgi:hypothetical protein